jgi:hypothetical protein
MGIKIKQQQLNVNERHCEKTRNGTWWSMEDKNGAIFLRIDSFSHFFTSIVLTSN